MDDRRLVSFSLLDIELSPVILDDPSLAFSIFARCLDSERLIGVHVRKSDGKVEKEIIRGS